MDRITTTLVFGLEDASKLCAISHTLAQLPAYLNGLKRFFPDGQLPDPIGEIIRDFPAEKLLEHAECITTLAALVLDGMLDRNPEPPAFSLSGSAFYVPPKDGTAN